MKGLSGAVLGLGLGLMGVTAAQAQPSMPGTGVQVSDAWSRATPAGADEAAVYVTLKAPAPDKLLSVSSPEAKRASVQRVVAGGNALSMQDLPDGLMLPPGQPVVLLPGGYHIMLSGLNGPLKLGQTFPLRLTFAVSQPVEVVARVAALAPPDAPAADTVSR